MGVHPTPPHLSAHRTPERSSATAWAALAAGILAWDIYACRTGRETLSAAYSRALARPTTRPPTLLATFYVVAHLTGSLLPPWCQRYDLLSLAAIRLRTLGKEVP